MYVTIILWAAAFVLMNKFIGMQIALFTFIAMSTLYLLCYHHNEISDTRRQLALFFLIVFGYVIAYATVYYAELSPYWIPASTVPILTILLYSQPELALFTAIAMSIIVGLISGGDFVLATIFLMGGIAGICASWQARRRSQIVWTGFLVGLVQFFTLAFFNNFRTLEPMVRNAGFTLAVNGLISSGIVMSLLWFFESLFKVVTNISLLELSDMNHPLIKRMILEAPGTYHHSLIVGNLSEAAAQAIGANALLARVGSYYHDIGKIEKANYFSENQKGDSAHRVLSASMSKLVIMNHVKDGMELAKRYHLKPAIIDFITQHHGKSLVYFFYRRALEQGVDDQEIKEEPFRYSGPKPQSKETAIVLLADSVEAATRSIENPTPSRTEEVVRKMINNKFIDSQLDECDLTLKDLEIISEIFIHILSGIYHTRVEYPDQNENKNKKSTKQNSNKSASNNKDSQGGPGQRESKT